MFPGGKYKFTGFSTKNKIQQHHGDGTQTIICMGRPFRVERRLTATNLCCGGRSQRAKRNEGNSFVYFVENSSQLSEFPAYLVLKRVFFNVDEITEAHKEIGILSSIKDKNIVRVFHSEIARSEGKISVTIAMEYCSTNLAKRIGSTTSARLTEAEICHILFAITSALGYLHSLQPPIAHRNISPENILIKNNMTGPFAYMLTNFESASTEAYLCVNREEALLASEDIEKHINPAFRPPEMADPWSKRRICEKCDMWMLGVLLYYMLYLKLPFEATNMALSGNPKVNFPSTVTASFYTGSLRTIIEHLLDPNPDTRWDVFALTNFLRFDEDVNRHLGTFCFTRTEYPEGWEEQDVKVVNRDPPPKAPPVTYGEVGHATAKQQHLEQRRELSQITSKNYLNDAVEEVMLMTDAAGARGLNNEEIEQYRKMIMQEQREAWEEAKKSKKSSDPIISVGKDGLEDLFLGGPEKSTVNPAVRVSAPSENTSSVVSPPHPFPSDGIFSLIAPQPVLEPSLFSPREPVWGSVGSHLPLNTQTMPHKTHPNFTSHLQMMETSDQQQHPGDLGSMRYGSNFPPGGCSVVVDQPQAPQFASPMVSQMNIDFLSSSANTNEQHKQHLTKVVGNEKNDPSQNAKKDPFADLVL